MEEAEYCLLNCPTDVIYLIVNYLAVRSIVKLTATCKHFSQINCPALMRSIVLRKNDRQIQPAMQKLALFTRLQHLVLGLQSENEEDVYQGLRYLTTLTQLRDLTLRVKLNHLDMLGPFFGNLISLQTLNIRVIEQSYVHSHSLNGLQHLGSKLECLTISTPDCKNLDFLPHLTNLKYLVLVAARLKKEDMENVLKLTKLTHLAFSTDKNEHGMFFQQISKLKSLQVFIADYSSQQWNGFGISLEHFGSPLQHVSTSLTNLHTLIWNLSPLSIPEEISKLENLRVFRTRGPITESEVVKLVKLPYLDIQTDNEETFTSMMATRRQMIHDIKLSSPNITDEEISSSIAKVTLVEKGLFPN